ncbi:MAG: hypothetical protein HRT47_12955 [Candidatus Caenarcaniphilales bacterium]|nr:hypothetical protein [Candidatus Caenarcaniphilales bacterium]
MSIEKTGNNFEYKLPSGDSKKQVDELANKLQLEGTKDRINNVGQEIDFYIVPPDKLEDVFVPSAETDFEIYEGPPLNTDFKVPSEGFDPKDPFNEDNNGLTPPPEGFDPKDPFNEDAGKDIQTKGGLKPPQ